MAEDLDSETSQTTSSRPGGGAGPDDADDESLSLLDLPEPKAAKMIFERWRTQTPILRFRAQQWRVNLLRRLGYTNVYVRKDEDSMQWSVYAPPGAVPNPVALNKLERLCERLTATLFVDSPVLEASPARDTDDARDASEFSTRLLAYSMSESGVGTTIKAQQAYDTCHTYDSGWIRYYVDPQGGGQRPMTVLAHPQALTLDQATKGPDGVPYSADQLVTRYVKPDRVTLTDEKGEAGVQYLPKLRSEVLTSKHVRLLPLGARDIWEAEGAMVGALVPLGRLKSAFPAAFKDLDKEGLKKLVSSQPEDAKDLMPAIARRRFKTELDRGKINDESLVFTITFYHIGNAGTYPKGAYLIVAGDEDNALMLDRRPWSDPNTGDPLDIALTQFKGWEREDDSYGLGLAEKIGPGNEARAFLQGATFEQVDRTLNRKVFYPITSTFQPKSAQAQLGTYIPINPGGVPKYEEVPDLPDAAEKLYQQISEEMDDDSGLQQTAQGVSTPSVKSGIHAQQIIEQVNVGLSGPRSNAVRALTRAGRIELQLYRAFFPVPQRVSWVGDDGLFKERDWTGADLGSTKDVQLSKGSFTMLAPSAKMAIAQQMFELKLLQPADLERIMVGNAGGLLALQDDPVRDRIRRQIGSWSDGPGDELVQAERQFQAAQSAANTQLPPGAQPPAPPPGPMQQKAAAIFTRLPSDLEQTVAALRHTELLRLLNSTKFSRWQPAWQAPVLAEYEAMRQAAGVATVAEQQKAQADAATAKQKEPISLSVSAKTAPLDEQQTLAVFRAGGVPLPPPVPVAPVASIAPGAPVAPAAAATPAIAAPLHG